MTPFAATHRFERMAAGLKIKRQEVLKLREGPPRLTLVELSKKTNISASYLSSMMRRAEKEREEDDKTT